MDFIAIDFETANAKRTSACSIGITVVENNKIVKKFHRLIKPSPVDFSPVNIQIHGITADDVANAPTFDELWKEICPLIDGKLIVAHNASFDISVLANTLSSYGINLPCCYYVCTYNLSRKIFPILECYRLNFISEILGVKLENHHNAECDSCACAEILLKYIEEYDISNIGDFEVKFDYKPNYLSANYFDTYKKPYYSHPMADAKKYKEIEAVYIDDDFSGKNFVFTGKLSTFSREKAMEIVKKGGGTPQNSITKQTNFLVSGIQDLSLIKNRDGYSTKMLKALQYKKLGCNIEIIGEDQFVQMIDDELLKLCV